MHDPTVTPVTIPELFTVAVPGVAETHGLTSAAVPWPVSWVVDPTQTAKTPEMMLDGFTVTVAVARHPPLVV
jgi:hypothetical protein